MGQLKEFFFSKYASSALDDCLKSYREKYTPKKGRRFNLDNITYEVGETKIKNGNLEYEISSKIPETEIGGDYSLDEYFKDVKKIILAKSNKPTEIDMDEIIRKDSDSEIKTRDYVRMKFCFPISSLYDDEKLLSLYESIKRGESSEVIPTVPGITSPMGCMALKMAQETILSRCTQSVENLINANKKVREKKVGET